MERIETQNNRTIDSVQFHKFAENVCTVTAAHETLNQKRTMCEHETEDGLDFSWGEMMSPTVDSPCIFRFSNVPRKYSDNRNRQDTSIRPNKVVIARFWCSHFLWYSRKPFKIDKGEI